MLLETAGILGAGAALSCASTLNAITDDAYKTSCLNAKIAMAEMAVKYAPMINTIPKGDWVKGCDGKWRYNDFVKVGTSDKLKGEDVYGALSIYELMLNEKYHANNTYNKIEDLMTDLHLSTDPDSVKAYSEYRKRFEGDSFVKLAKVA